MGTEINSKNGSKTRLLFIVTQSEFGGAQRFLHSLITKLNKDQYDITLATGFQGDDSFSNELKTKGFKVIKLSRLARDISPINDILAIFQIRDLIISESPNILFLNSSKAGFIGSMAAKLLNQAPRVIYRIGGWSFRDPGPKWKSWLWRTLEKISSNWKDYIIVNSQEDFNIAEKLKIKPKRELILIHNGIDVYKTETIPQDQARAELKIPSDKIIVGTIANYYPAKGLINLIEAISFLKHREDIHFVLIGDGPEKSKIKDRIDLLNIENKITLAGRIDNASKLISAFDIFLLPSLKEGFPWVLIEAMASKTPVIATSVGATPEILDNGKNGLLIEPGQPKKIVEAILYLADNERVRSEMSILGHQTVLFKFNQEKMISLFEDIFHKSLITNE